MKIYSKKFVSGQVTLIFALACFPLSPQARALCQEGCLTNANTVLGDNALLNNTTGLQNTAIGSNALENNTTGFNNTAIGALALSSNTIGHENTAIGFDALSINTTGSNNTAIGLYALLFNTTGSLNTATGNLALYSNGTGNSNTATGDRALNLNSTGSNNTANGALALGFNTTGSLNTATGFNALNQNARGSDNTANGASALEHNTTGSDNTATGSAALANDTNGSENTATGFHALLNNTNGNNNIALGFRAGSDLTTSDNNIDIGNPGQPGESSTIRIGRVQDQTATFIAGISGATVPTGVAVIVNANGHLGTTTSSARFKDNVQPMDKASEAILALKPVTFHYKKELDPEGIPQFGLVAEQVEKVNPDLVARDEQGKPYTVRYEAVNAMLLNEFLKEHGKVQELEATVAQQQKGMEVLAAQVKEQAAQIQKVSAQIEASKPAPQMVVDNH